MIPEQLEFYNSKFLNLSTSGLSGLYHKYSHRKMEKLVPRQIYGNTLELGVGDNQHQIYVSVPYSMYIGIDLRPGSYSDVEFIQGDVNFIPLKDNSIQRVIVTCLLHHVGSTIKVLTEINRIIDNNSDFDITIIVPCDPGILYRFVKFIRDFFIKVKSGQGEAVSARYIHYIEHIGSYPSIDRCIKYVFSEFLVSKKSYPLNLETWNLNLFSVYNISKNNFSTLTL